jgi:ATP phosphoribosyltransferase
MEKINGTKSKNKLVIGLPKGSLQKPTFELLKKAGFEIDINPRSYFPTIDDQEIECVLLRAQEIATYVESGILDMGITGKDWIVESQADVEEVSELIYSKKGLKPVRWVLAVPNNSKIKSVKDLEGKRIATEVIRITKSYLKKNKINAKVDFSWGATEVKTKMLSDAIVDITETGDSLKANNLKIIDTLLESTTRIISNKQSWNNAWKRKKIGELNILLQGVLNAQKNVGLMMNVRKKDLNHVLKVLPALQNPTISELSNNKWCSVTIIIEKQELRKLIPKLKEKKAEGIVEFPLNKIIN